MLTERQFAAVYRKHVDQIWRFCYLRTHDHHLAEDMTQEAFTRAWQSPSFADANHRAFLYRIAQNLLVDNWRRKREVLFDEPPAMIDEGTRSPLEQAHLNESVREIAAALTKVPKRLKDVVIFRFVEQLSAKETARIMRTSEGNVRVLQHRAIGELRKVLKHDS